MPTPTKKISDISAITTTLSTMPTSQTAKENGKSPLPPLPTVPTIIVNMNEQNNNSINTSKQGILHGLPETFTDIDLVNHNKLNDHPYINGDLYKSYIYGKSLKIIKFKLNSFLL